MAPCAGGGYSKHRRQPRRKGHTSRNRRPSDGRKAKGPGMGGMASVGRELSSRRGDSTDLNESIAVSFTKQIPLVLKGLLNQGMTMAQMPIKAALY